MALPQGFDPVTGRFTGITSPRISTTINRPTPTPPRVNFGTRRSSSLWERLNNGIKSFGNWIDSKIEVVSGWTCAIAGVGCAIALLFWVFSDSDIFSIILRIIGACIAGYIAMIGIGIAAVIVSLALKVVRFVFWNIYTLIIALIIAAVFFVNGYSKAHSDVPSYEAPTEVAATTPYRVTAHTLNVRSLPSKTSYVLGTVKKNDIVEVYEVTNGFARIEFNGGEGYVSTKYLSRY